MRGTSGGGRPWATRLGSKLLYIWTSAPKSSRSNGRTSSSRPARVCTETDLNITSEPLVMAHLHSKSGSSLELVGFRGLVGRGGKGPMSASTRCSEKASAKGKRHLGVIFPLAPHCALPDDYSGVDWRHFAAGCFVTFHARRRQGFRVADVRAGLFVGPLSQNPQPRSVRLGLVFIPIPRQKRQVTHLFQQSHRVASGQKTGRRNTLSHDA